MMPLLGAQGGMSLPVSGKGAQQ